MHANCAGEVKKTCGGLKKNLDMHYEHIKKYSNPWKTKHVYTGSKTVKLNSQQYIQNMHKYVSK